MEALRLAINMPIQSAASDITLAAVFKVHEWINTDPKCEEAGLVMVNSVHDSIVFECKENYVEWACKKIKLIMEDKTGLDWLLCVPSVDFEVGDNYGELEALDI